MLSSPTEVCLGITSQCNLNCRHCIAGTTRDNSNLTTPELFGVIDQLAEAKVFKVSIFGGEPLIHPDFFKIVERIRRYPILINGLNTNACLVDEAMAKKLWDFRIRSFAVSFDGASAQVMDKMRGKGAFDACLKGIRHLLALGANIMLSATVTRYNLKDIRNMVVLAKSLKVASIRFNQVFSGGNAACFEDEVVIKPREELEAIKEIYQLYKEFGDFITGSYLQQKGKLDKLQDFIPEKDFIMAPPCGAATNRCNIRPDGKVTPCEVIWDAVAGDLRQQPFLEIWRKSALFNELRRPKKINLKDKPDCQGCGYQYLCFVGHRCYPYYFPEGLKDKDLYCWKGIAREELLTD